MRAPALPRGWGPLDNPYCTPHPLVLPPWLAPLAAAPGRIYSDRSEEFCPRPTVQREIIRRLSEAFGFDRNFSKMVAMSAAIFPNFWYTARLDGQSSSTRKGFSEENAEVERADNTFPSAYIHDHIPPLVSPHPPNNSRVVQSGWKADGNLGLVQTAQRATPWRAKNGREKMQQPLQERRGDLGEEGWREGEIIGGESFLERGPGTIRILRSVLSNFF